MPEIIATGQVSVVDLSDSHTLSCYIAANLPRVQVHSPTAGGANRPDWSKPPHLILTPIVFLDQTIYEPGKPGLTLVWKRREGIGQETELVGGEAVKDGTLTVSRNLLTNIESGMLTYILYATYSDPAMQTTAEVTSDITFTQMTDGVQGESSVVMSLYAPDGTVFLDGSGSLRLQVSAYKGPDSIAKGATFVWKTFSAGAWHIISGKTGSTLTVKSSDVEGTRTFRCEMTYAGETYIDAITLMDRTDVYQAEIEATNGDTLLPGSDTILVCHLFQNASEIDGMRDAPIGERPPANPADGAYWYRVTREGPIILCRFNADAMRWDDLPAEEQSGMKYSWYRVDKDGHPVDTGAWLIGKLVYVGAGMIDEKMTCKVEVDRWGEE